MSSNSRDLKVDISGDASGFDKAVLTAKQSAEVFEKELARLERQQLQQELALKRAARATEEFSKRNNEAAQAARKLGLAAADAGDRAATAQRRAAAESEKLARGQGNAERAASLEAKALREVERAAIAAAAAQKADSKAAEELARNEAQAAREGIVAAGTQRLEHLRATGQIKQHNDLLRRLRTEYKGFGSDIKEMEAAGGRAFGLLTRVGTSTFEGLSSAGTSLAELGPLWIVGIVAALALLPPAAMLAAGALTLGLGGALAVIGIKSAANAESVKKDWASTGSFISSEMPKLSAPFQTTMSNIAKIVQSTFVGFEPVLASVFSEMGPTVSQFATRFGASLLELRPAVAAVGHAFDEILARLGPALPGIMHNLGAAITQIAQAAGDHAQEITQFAMAIGVVARIVSELISLLAKVGPTFNLGIGVLNAFGVASAATADKVGASTFAISALGDAAKATQADVTALDDAITKLLDPSLAISNATLRWADDLATLQGLLKKSKGAIDDQTAAGRAAHVAFNKQIKDVADLAQAQGKLDGNTARANATIKSHIAQLWALANGNKDAEAQVRKLAQVAGVTLPANLAHGAQGAREMQIALLGIKSRQVDVKADIHQLQQQIEAAKAKLKTVPPSRQAAIRADIRQLQEQVAYAKALLAQIQSKTITINTNYSSTGPGHAATGGLIGHYAGGGPVRHMAMAGRVTGPGTDMSDSIPAMLSNGEFVVRASAARQNLALLEAINSGGGSAPVVAHSTPSAPRPMGGGTLEIVLRTAADSPGMGTELLKTLRVEIRGRGGDPVKVLTPR